MIFYSSDHHFWHRAVIEYCKRPYTTVEEMNEGMVASWNAKVAPTDEVWYLGDFSLSQKALIYVSRLNGVKRLIPGNHDKAFPFADRTPEKLQREAQKYIDAGFASVHHSPVMTEIAGVAVRMWHLPYATPEGDHVPHNLRYLEYRPVDDGTWLLCGHVHQSWKTNGKMINVGVDVWDMAPVSEAEIAALILNPPQVGLTVYDHVD